MAARKVVFVVDDEHVIARTLAIILSRAGFDTESFVSAEAVLERAQSKRPDAIVSDVILDGMSGIRLAEVLEDRLPGVPIVLISGQTSTSELLRAAEKQGHPVFIHPKPIQPATLIAEVSRLLLQADEAQGLIAA